MEPFQPDNRFEGPDEQPGDEPANLSALHYPADPQSLVQYRNKISKGEYFRSSERFPRLTLSARHETGSALLLRPLGQKNLELVYRKHICKFYGLQEWIGDDLVRYHNYFAQIDGVLRLDSGDTEILFSFRDPDTGEYLLPHMGSFHNPHKLPPELYIGTIWTITSEASSEPTDFSPVTEEIMFSSGAFCHELEKLEKTEEKTAIHEVIRLENKRFQTPMLREEIELIETSSFGTIPSILLKDFEDNLYCISNITAEPFFVPKVASFHPIGESVESYEGGFSDLVTEITSHTPQDAYNSLAELQVRMTGKEGQVPSFPTEYLRNLESYLESWLHKNMGPLRKDLELHLEAVELPEYPDVLEIKASLRDSEGRHYIPQLDSESKDCRYDKYGGMTFQMYLRNPELPEVITLNQLQGRALSVKGQLWKDFRMHLRRFLYRNHPNKESILDPIALTGVLIHPEIMEELLSDKHFPTKEGALTLPLLRNINRFSGYESSYGELVELKGWEQLISEEPNSSNRSHILRCHHKYGYHLVKIEPIDSDGYFCLLRSIRVLGSSKKSSMS